LCFSLLYILYKMLCDVSRKVRYLLYVWRCELARVSSDKGEPFAAAKAGNMTPTAGAAAAALWEIVKTTLRRVLTL